MKENAVELIYVIFFVWVASQLIKFITSAIKEKSFSSKMLTATGGMPSAHSATVSCLTIGLGMQYGFGSPFFAISGLYAFIVMHDAVKVRQAIGNNTKVIKTFLSDVIVNEYVIQTELFEMIEDEHKKNPKENSNKILKNLQKTKKEIDTLKALNVVLGHTPFEVFVGAIFGGITAFVYMTFFV